MTAGAPELSLNPGWWCLYIGLPAAACSAAEAQNQWNYNTTAEERGFPRQPLFVH